LHIKNKIKNKKVLMTTRRESKISHQKRVQLGSLYIERNNELFMSVAEPNHIVAAPAPGWKNYAAPAPNPRFVMYCIAQKMKKIYIFMWLRLQLSK
jgi:hypothetical protein